MQKFTSNVLPKLQLNNSCYEYRKYKILQIIDNYPSYLCRLYKNELPKQIGVNRQTFANWLNASTVDTMEIPSVKLAIIAKTLKVPIEDLFNISIPEISIEPKEVTFKKNILASTGLVI